MAACAGLAGEGEGVADLRRAVGVLGLVGLVGLLGAAVVGGGGVGGVV